LDHGLHVLKLQFFPPNRPPKMLEKHQLFFGLRIPTSRNPNQNKAALWCIFSSNKSVPANKKTGFYENRDPHKQEVGFIFALSGSELESLFKYSRVKLKIKNLKRLMSFLRPIKWYHSQV
jgi:hypothetical protein